MFKDRISLYQEIEKRRNSKLLVYITGDRPGFETQIHPEILDYSGGLYYLSGKSGAKNPTKNY